MPGMLILTVIVAAAVWGCGSPQGNPDVPDIIEDIAGDVPADDLAPQDTVSDGQVDTTGADANPDVIFDVSDVQTVDVALDHSPAVTSLDLSDVGDIHAMWGSPGASVWAVGSDGLVLVLRGDQFVPGPLAPTDADLFGIAGAGDSIYVVGADGVALRWRDGLWEDLLCPAARDLLSISCPSSDECFAVGRGGTIAHYLDGVWDLQDAGVSWDLFGVLSEVNGGTWIVGAFGSLFELSGSVWVSSQIAGSVSSMKDIYRAPDGTLVAVGSRGTIVKREPGSTRWQQQLSNETYEPGRDLYSITGTSSTDMWAVGDSGAIIHFDGTHWELSTVSGPVNVFADFRAAVSATWLADPESDVDSGVLLAGGLMSSLVLFDEVESVWLDHRAGPFTDLNAVWVVDADSDAGAERAVFVGGDGLALEFTDGRFGLIETGVAADLNSISGGVVVGDSGVVGLVQVDAESGAVAVVPVISSTVEDLVDVFGDDDGWIMAGSEGTVFSMDESLSPAFLAQVSGVLTSICRTGAGLFVGGENGLLAAIPAGSVGDPAFLDVVTFTQSAIRDIAPLQDGRVVAVGDNGIVLVCDVHVCEKVYSDPTSFLYAVGGSGSDTSPLFAAGWAGVILRYDGEGVVPVESGTMQVFRGLDAGIDGGTVFLAGQRGSAAILDPAVAGGR